MNTGRMFIANGVAAFFLALFGMGMAITDRSQAPTYLLIGFVSMLIASTAIRVSIILKAQANRIEKLEQRLTEVH